MTRLTTPETDAALEGAWPAPGPRIIFAEAEPEHADPGVDAPTAVLTVDEAGQASAALYAPGLPAGQHDVWCMPVDAAAELMRLRDLCSHAGILRAQEQHNAMMAEKDAQIARLRQQVAHFESLALRARSAKAGR